MATSNQPRTPQVPWSPERRSWVSLILFAHLFAVVIAVTSYTRPSILQTQLHRLFAPYLHNLHLTAYGNYPFARYYLTHAGPTDADFTCEVEFQDASSAKQVIVIPESGLRPNIRARRYQALANVAGTLAGDELFEQMSGVLPRAIAGSILKRHGASQGVIRLKMHGLPNIESMPDVDAGKREALKRYDTVYEAQVFVSGDSVELLKKPAQVLETAPVETNRKPSNALRGKE